MAKRFRFWFFLTIVVLTGCALLQKDDAVIPDERAGPNLVVYFAEDRNTRRIARTIARTSGGELFDISGKKPLPGLLGYDTFFVGASLTEGRVAPALEEFLARTDFMDGRVVPFWASPGGPDSGSAGLRPAEDMNKDFENLLRGARLLPGGGFAFPRRVKAKDLEEMAGAWTETALTELGLRRAAGGDYAEDMAKLFAEAYSGRLGPAVFQDGDWTLEMDGVLWRYAQGRFLPPEDADRPEDFRPLFLYRYSPEAPAGPGEASPWQDRADRLISRRPSGSYSLYRLNVNPGAVRSPFFAAIWQAHTRAEAFSRQKWIDFLGWPVRIHQDIEAPLGRVEARIRELAKSDPEIPLWLNTLASITGWNWRNVAGSANLSFHSYGAAVDLLMKPQVGKETYWQWTASRGIDWRSVPAENRLNPPVAVIRAFEEQGFIWGGRWTRYDTMHFEYHPELLILGTGRNAEAAS
jgi:flavodoxin